jgi:hypothetical protein
MTTEPAISRFDDRSPLGLIAVLGATVVAGSLCAWAGLEPHVTSSVTAFAGALPAAIALHMKGRRRDINRDTARVRDGDLRRPVGLVVVLLAAAVLLLDTAVGAMAGGIQGRIGDLIRAGIVETSTAQVVASLLTSFLFMLLGICLFLVASYASHYLGKYPYLWTAGAVGCALVVRVLAVRVSWESMLKSAMGVSIGMFLLGTIVFYLGVLVVCMAGAWFGRRHHDEFLATKLARMERKAPLLDAATQPQATATKQTAPANLPAPNARERRLE